MLFQRKRLFSSFVTPDFKKRQKRNKTSLKSGTKFTGMFTSLVIKLKIPLILKVQTRTTLEQMRNEELKNEKFCTIKKKHDSLHFTFSSNKQYYFNCIMESLFSVKVPSSSLN